MAEILIKHWCLYNNDYYYTKVSSIPSGSKLMKRYDILTCENIMFDNIFLFFVQLH